MKIILNKRYIWSLIYLCDKILKHRCCSMTISCANKVNNTFAAINIETGLCIDNAMDLRLNSKNYRDRIQNIKEVLLENINIGQEEIIINMKQKKEDSIVQGNDITLQEFLKKVAV